jgi:hypothetical protein
LLTSGCADSVVVKPVALTPVNASLMRGMSVPKCDVSGRTGNELYYFDEVDASRVCWRQGFRTAHARLTGLQRAVRVRQQATAKAVAASN